MLEDEFYTPRNRACDPLSSFSFPSFQVPSQLLDTLFPRYSVPIHDTIEGPLTHKTYAPHGLREEATQGKGWVGGAAVALGAVICAAVNVQ